MKCKIDRYNRCVWPSCSELKTKFNCNVRETKKGDCYYDENRKLCLHKSRFQNVKDGIIRKLDRHTNSETYYMDKLEEALNKKENKEKIINLLIEAVIATPTSYPPYEHRLNELKIRTEEYYSDGREINEIFAIREQLKNTEKKLNLCLGRERDSNKTINVLQQHLAQLKRQLIDKRNFKIQKHLPKISENYEDEDEDEDEDNYEDALDDEADVDHDEDDLPPNWGKKISRSTAEEYYVNYVTGESTYKKPRSLAVKCGDYNKKKWGDKPERAEACRNHEPKGMCVFSRGFCKKNPKYEKLFKN
tara:strand:+ start:40 stop:951 length:912 start_codon:yes stop_codon:yes gene_type:complete